MSLRAAPAIILVLSLAACRAQEEVTGSDGTWVGTMTTEGNVTTVVNESGSVWGGPATLVEEASIGVEAGDAEYMLGSPGGLFATDDEVYVIDTQVPIVRVYDREGIHLRDIGGEGQGPGEYGRPGEVLVGPDGRVYVSEAGAAARINVYSAAGEPVDTWTWSETGPVSISGSQAVMRDDGAVLLRATWYPPGQQLDRDARRYGWQRVGPDGPVGEPVEQPDLGIKWLEIAIGRGNSVIPYSPMQVNAYTPTGAFIVGDNNSYAFEVRHADGRITRATRFWTPVTVSVEEREYHERIMTANGRRLGGDPAWIYDGPEIPDRKPAYAVFTPTQDGRVQVTRYGPSRYVEGCDLRFDLDERPTGFCFEMERLWDMFDLDGRYLGEVERPDVPITYAGFWRGNALWIVVEDDAGLIMVKRYRLVPPGEGAP